MVRQSKKLRNFEALESKKLMTADLGVDMPVEAETAEIHFMDTDATHTAELEFVEVGGGELNGKPVCYLKYKLDRAFIKSWSMSGEAVAPVQGEVVVSIPREDITSFIADSFSFGVEREMKESGEKGGTEDINIGVGELQECTISQSMHGATANLAPFAINGNSCGTAKIDFVEVAERGDASGLSDAYVTVELPIAFVESWSISGDADDRPTEEVAFYYNKIAFGYAATTDGKAFDVPGMMAWDNVKNEPHNDSSRVAAREEHDSSDASNYFIADSFSFGVEREMKESGEKGGTEDSNIGGGERQKGNMAYDIDAAMETWGDADDRPTEEVAFYYNKIA